MEILFYRRSSSAQKLKGTCSIQCRITIDGERAELGSTHVEVKKEHFNDTTKRISYHDPHAQLHNLRLQEEYETRILAIYNDLLLKKQVITAAKIKKIFLGEDDTSALTLMEGYDIFLKDFERQTKQLTEAELKKKKRKKSESTLRPLRNCRNKLLKYLVSTRNTGIAIADIDQDFFEQYEQYLWDLNHEQSYIVKQLRTLTQLTRWLKRKKHIKINPLADIEVEKEESKNPHYLTQEQFERWCNFKWSNPNAQVVADIFILYCRTAFHYEDLRQVIQNPDMYFKKGLDGMMWIYKPREKTEEVAKIPIDAFNASIKQVIQKYGSWKNIPIPSNNTLNDWLKLCVAEINMHLPQKLRIYEQLSVKHGRTTFCYWWINELGRSIESLLPIMGRKSGWGLSRYVRPDERAIIAALKLLKKEKVKKAG